MKNTQEFRECPSCYDGPKFGLYLKALFTRQCLVNQWFPLVHVHLGAELRLCLIAALR